MLKYDSNEMFIVERGYLNRTRYYLYPAVVLMKSYKNHIAKLKENLLCVSYEDDGIICYYDRKNTLGLHELIRALKQNNEYIKDFMYNENVYAVKISPPINYGAFEEGSYTDIYEPDQLKLVFTSKSKTRMVLTKDPDYKQSWVDTLNDWFNTKHTIESLESRENGISVPITQYDIPPCMNQEIVNFKKSLSVEGGYTKNTRGTYKREL